jgi:hypothetical protein
VSFAGSVVKFSYFGSAEFAARFFSCGQILNKLNQIALVDGLLNKLNFDFRQVNDYGNLFK